jgi:hypothetical protein
VLTRGEHFLVNADTEARLEVGPGEGVQSTLVFEVDGPVDLASASLIIDAPGEEPAVLPLSGEAPALPYPREGTASGRSGAIDDDNGTDKVVVEARTARAALDHAEVRAPRGMMLVIVGVRFTAPAGEGDAVVRDHFFRLRVGNDVVGPARDLRETARPGEWVDLEIPFPVPVGATHMTLSIGQDGAEDATFPVSVPPAG